MSRLFMYIKYFIRLVKKSTILYLCLKTIEAIFFSVETLIVAILIDNILNNLSDVWAILINTLSLFSFWILRWVIESLGQYVWVKIRKTAYEKLPNIVLEKKKSFSYEVLEDKNTQELIRRIGIDIEKKVCDYFSNNIYLLQVTVEIIGLLLLIATKCFGVTLVLLLIMIPFLHFSARNGKISYEAYEESEEILREADYFKSVISGRDYIEERKIFRTFGFFNGLWSERYKKAITVESKANWNVFSRIEFANVVSGIIIVIMFFVLLCASPKWAISIGFLISVMKSFINLIDIITANFGKRVSTFEKGKLFFEDFVKFIELDSESEKEKQIEELCVDTIEFVDVSFSYSGSNQKVFNHLNLKLNSDVHYAIVGANGAGKSTLLKLMMGIYKDYSGNILINGVDIREMGESTVQHLFEYVPQDITKYEIALDEYLKEESASLINDMFDEYGIDFIKADDKQPILGRIEKGAVDLSRGQWQQLAIVRASLSKRKIVVLDEPTAAIDPIKEMKLYDLFKKLMKKRFTIIISHRLGIAKMADEIIVLSNGSVMEKGTHKELIEKGKYYREMYNTQKSWYEVDA